MAMAVMLMLMAIDGGGGATADAETHGALKVRPSCIAEEAGGGTR